MTTVFHRAPSFLEICPEWALRSNPATQTGTVMETDFQPAPLKPSWIIDGTPIARSLPLGEAADGNLSFGLWDCTAGQFLFRYRSDELVHILEGEAIVRDPARELHLHPGVIAFFPRGTTMHWTVPRYVKKLAIFRSTPLSYPHRLKDALRRLWRRVTLNNQPQRAVAHSHAAMTQPSVSVFSID